MKPLMTGEDPYLANSATEKLFPQLTLEHNGCVPSMPCTSSSTSSASVAPAVGVGKSGQVGVGGAQTLHLVTLREGDRSVTLPRLSIEQNYPQMLSELVMHIWAEKSREIMESKLLKQSLGIGTILAIAVRILAACIRWKYHPETKDDHI